MGPSQEACRIYTFLAAHAGVWFPANLVAIGADVRASGLRRAARELEPHMPSNERIDRSRLDGCDRYRLVREAKAEARCAEEAV